MRTDPVWHSPILELFDLASVIERITHFVLVEGAWGGVGRRLREQ